jgi:SAM-dependent methyltransferase
VRDGFFVLFPADLFRTDSRRTTLAGKTRRYDEVPLFNAFWAALDGANCPLTPGQREQAKRNRTFILAKKVFIDLRRGRWRLAMYRWRSSGLSTGDWLRYLRWPRRDAFAGTPLGSDGDFTLPAWARPRRGFDRGTPIDRYYLEKFLDTHRALITGRVLEVQLPSYTERFGEHVCESHTVDINPEFRSTYTCDLADAAQIPTDYYDCFLVPNTLQHLVTLEPALRTMLRVVKPGGTILLSAAGLLPLIPEGGDRFSCSGVEREQAAIRGSREDSCG